jgi:hypothetical protein
MDREYTHEEVKTLFAQPEETLEQKQLKEELAREAAQSLIDAGPQKTIQSTEE